LISKPVATIFSGLSSKPVVGFLVEPQNQGGGEFFRLSLKSGSYGLVIWALKSLRQFLDLDLKINHASVYQLRYKINGGRSVWYTR
jgi:hypothetical protein